MILGVHRLLISIGAVRGLVDQCKELDDFLNSKFNGVSWIPHIVYDHVEEDFVVDELLSEFLDSLLELFHKLALMINGPLLLQRARNVKTVHSADLGLVLKREEVAFVFLLGSFRLWIVPRVLWEGELDGLSDCFAMVRGQVTQFEFKL